MDLKKGQILSLKQENVKKEKENKSIPASALKVWAMHGGGCL
jgi:hypothetical protein